jgi:asparagine synthase (glutamine-hydrolysing)
MSAIFGVFHLDGAPADRELLENMSASLSGRASDGEGLVTLGPAALGHRMFHTTSESLQETQPHRDETGSLWLTLDGRVDNRTELRTLLESKGVILRQDTDAELVLRAYEAWGDECPARILGDFAFAVWDARRRRLFLARDFLGIKPLYYATSGLWFVFASGLQPLLLTPGFERRPNEGMIAEYLSCVPASLTETFFQDVFRLPPAHCMTVTEAGPSAAVRYWSADEIEETHDLDDSQYEARFREVLISAIRSRMRCQVPVGADLSGGLDSSSIVSLMHAFPPEAHRPPFEAFSLIFPSLPCDETEFITAALQKSGARGNLIPPSSVDPSIYVRQAQTYADIPDYPATTAYYPLLRRAREKGIRVLLTGAGGDDWFTGSTSYYADLLKCGRILLLARYLREDARAEVFAYPYKSLYLHGIRPLVPRALIRVLRKLKWKAASPWPWISGTLLERTRLSERLRPSGSTPSGKSFAQDAARRMAYHAGRAHSLEGIDRWSAEFGIEHRHPFHDRRVVEFALSLPESQRRTPGVSKNVLRRAMKDLLPSSILFRRSKADASHHYALALETIGTDSIFTKMATAKRGWVDQARLCRMAEDLLHSYHSGSDSYISLTWPVWRVLAIELWARYALESSSHAHRGEESQFFGPGHDSKEDFRHAATRG